MRKSKQPTRWIFTLAAVCLATASFGANRLDMFTLDKGDVNNAYDNWFNVVHTFASDKENWNTWVFQDPQGNVLPQGFFNPVVIQVTDVLRAVRNSLKEWNNVPISTFRFGSLSVLPADMHQAIFPGQLLLPGTSGLDNYNLLTFQDITQTPTQGVLGLSTAWLFYMDVDLSSFIELPDGVILADPPGAPDPGQAATQVVQIDFDLDGFPDVILPSGKYRAGEVFESDTWLNGIEQWNVYPDEVGDLEDWATSAGVVGEFGREDAAGTLDVEGTVTHEFGHLMGIAHADLEKSSMYYLLKGPFNQGTRYPTDVWDARELDLDDEVAAALIYPKAAANRGTIAGMALDGGNFDGVSDITSGIPDQVFYATIEVLLEMTTGMFPAGIPDKVNITSTVQQVFYPTTTFTPTQFDLDTSPRLWLEKIVTIQTSDDIRVAIWPNPQSVYPPSSNLTTTGGTIQAHLEASGDWIIPGLPESERYVLRVQKLGVYENDQAGVATNNISGPYNYFSSLQVPFPTEFYGGSVDRFQRNILGPDSPMPLTNVTTAPLVQTGDNAASWTLVAVRAGLVTAGITIYSNMGGLPAGVTPTPNPLASPTPSPISNTTFTPDAFSETFLPFEQEWSVGAAVGDVDNDGDVDIYICNAVSGQTSQSAFSLMNRLYQNQLITRQPDGTLVRNPQGLKFIDITFGEDGIPKTGDDRLPFDLDLSFGAKMADFNLDGYLDIYVSNTESMSQGTATGAENRLYVNRGAAQPGFFDDVTAWPRTDAGIAIPTTYTATIMPGILNEGPFSLLYADISTKSDAGDIDSDGDIDIVVANYGLGGANWPGPPRTAFFAFFRAEPDPYTMIGGYSERILINHANDFDPDTRGFYFTDETLGMDGLVNPFAGKADFGEVINPLNARPEDNRIAADRMPPTYPDLAAPAQPFANCWDESLTFEVILAPVIGDNSLDIVVINRFATPSGSKTGTEFLYENSDIDGDGVADGYFRQVNFGTDWIAPVSTPAATLEIAGLFGLGGVNVGEGDPGDLPGEGDMIGPDQTDSYGGVVLDQNYHGRTSILTFDGLAGAQLIDMPNVDEVNRFEAGAGGGLGLVYQFEGAWGNPPNPYTKSAPLPITANLARDAAAADFDGDGDIELYVAMFKNLPENNIDGVPVINEYLINDGYGVFTNATLLATSGTAQPTYDAFAADFDLDGDNDILTINTGGPKRILLNRLYIKPPDVNNPFDNPLFRDATPEFLPPFFMPSSDPPFTGTAFANLTVNTVTGDLNGDDLPDMINANGALYTSRGDSTMVYLNHGKPQTPGTTVFTPISATYPGPRIPSPGDLSTLAAAGFWGGFYYLNAAIPAYDAAMVDLDLDGDYDVVQTSLGLGPRVFANMDSNEMDDARPASVTELEWGNRVLNSIADQDLLGDGILLPADGPTGSFIPGFSAPISIPAIVDPGPAGGQARQKKEQGRRMAYGDLNNDGTIDIVIGNGIPQVGAPNVMLINGPGPQRVGRLIDATETNLPVQTIVNPGGGTHQEGINDDTVDVAIADFDNDSWNEILFLNTGGGGTSSTRFLDNAGGNFVDTRVPGSPDASWVLPSYPSRMPSTLTVADFDRKGDPTEDTNGNGVLDSGEDKNHNGRLDWWDTTETEDTNGNGVLDMDEDGLAPFGPPNGVLDSADLNGDGEITPRLPGVFDASWDVFITFVDGADKLYLNSLPASEGEPTNFRLIDVTATHLPAVAASSYGADTGDVDLDGDLDLVISISTQSNLPHVLLYYNDGTGRFRQISEEIPPNTSILDHPSFGDSLHVLAHDVDLLDVDNDGDLDMHVSYLGTFSLAYTGGATDAFYVNRTISEDFNTLRRFRTYRSPYIVKLSPSSAVQGTQVTATITGQNLSDVKTLDLGEGVTVSTITRLGPDTYAAVVRVAPNAVIGTRDAVIVTESTQGEVKKQQTARLQNAFTVLPRKTGASAMWRRYE